VSDSTSTHAIHCAKSDCRRFEGVWSTEAGGAQLICSADTNETSLLKYVANTVNTSANPMVQIPWFSLAAVFTCEIFGDELLTYRQAFPPTRER
jgi:hypothetical protein